MSANRSEDQRLAASGEARGEALGEALGEIVRLAREDRRRGVRYWFDAQLATDLRAFVKEIDAGQPAAQAKSSKPESTRSSRRASGRAPVPPSVPSWGPTPEATGRDGAWAEMLRVTGEEALACTACGLCGTRTQVVFGTGSARVPLVFVGEAPGRDEDLQGIPFVGRAGQLLTRIIEAIGLRREDVYICNVLKCRPPENRNPAPEEIAACRHYLDRQLEILQPKVICTLGLFASQLLLESTAPIGKLRGRLLRHGSWKILPTYHPAALLRNPSLKAAVWEDVQLLRRVLDE